MVTRIRLWLIKRLLTHDEKHLLIRAIDARVEILRRMSMLDRHTDTDKVGQDEKAYLRIRKILSTSDWM